MVLILKKIATFELNRMPLQEINVLFFKRFTAMMLFLIADVILNRSGVGITNRKGSVPFLPFEMPL